MSKTDLQFENQVSPFGGKSDAFQAQTQNFDLLDFHLQVRNSLITSKMAVLLSSAKDGIADLQILKIKLFVRKDKIQDIKRKLRENLKC